MKWPRRLAWMDKGIPLSPVVRLRIVWITLIASAVGTLASPAFLLFGAELILVLTLFLSFLAILVTMVDILFTADVRKQQEDGDGQDDSGE